MKKLFLSLAALVMTMSAPVMTSCSSDLEEVAPGVVTPETETDTHVETLTIAFPEQAATRVGVDSDNKLTGWEEGDEVTLVRTYFEMVTNNDNFGAEEAEYTIVGTYTFKCTDAANGTFTGALPNGTSVNDCQLAFYNATDFETSATESGDVNRFYFSPKNRASQNMKDVIMLVAKNDGTGNFKMGIFGSILKVTNTFGTDITASVKYRKYGPSSYGYHYNGNMIRYDKESEYDNQSFEADVYGNYKRPFTLSRRVPTYVYIPVYNATTGDADYAVGLSAEDDATNVCSIVPFKTNPGNAKLFNIVLMGTAKATIGGNEVDVKWVRLWKNGPKFAEYNIGVTDGKAESYGGYYYWSSSIDKDPNGVCREGPGGLSDTEDTATNLWGSNWRMPTKDELDGLFANCDSERSTVNGVNGLKFTGRGDYASYSVFLPAAGFCFSGEIDEHDLGRYGGYWSSTPNGSYDAAYLFFDFNTSTQSTYIGGRNFGCSVRAVLAK